MWIDSFRVQLWTFEMRSCRLSFGILPKWQVLSFYCSLYLSVMYSYTLNDAVVKENTIVKSWRKTSRISCEVTGTKLAWRSLNKKHLYQFVPVSELVQFLKLLSTLLTRGIRSWPIFSLRFCTVIKLKVNICYLVSFITSLIASSLYYPFQFT